MGRGEAASSEHIAPSPDFRYVGLLPSRGSEGGIWPLAAAGMALMGTALAQGIHESGLAFACGGVVASGLVWHRVRRLRSRLTGHAAPMAIVPWGVLVDPDRELRVLRWAAVTQVSVDMFHDLDGGTPRTVHSDVAIRTLTGELLVGRASGAVGLERLLSHLPTYASEQARPLALDLFGERRGPGPFEPECKALLAAVDKWLRTPAAASTFELPPAGYRGEGARACTTRATRVLGDALRDKSGHAADVRAFAAACAAELGARELEDEIVALVQSPHPVVAAVAKGAAHKLGVATARAGSIDELAPFLVEADLQALRAWQRAA